MAPGPERLPSGRDDDRATDGLYLEAADAGACWVGLPVKNVSKRKESLFNKEPISIIC